MQENRFFKTVWRFNALILMAFGVLGIGVLGFAAYEIFKDVTRERAVANIVNVAEDQPVGEKWRLGCMTEIDNGPYVIVPLQCDQKYSMSSYDKNAESTRNILFINSATDDKKWLYSTNKYLLIDYETLSEKQIDDRNRPVRAIIYRVVKADTNEDSRLTYEDMETVALSQPDGGGYKEILSDIEVFIGPKMLDKDNMLIIYQKHGIGYSAKVSLTDFSVANESELPKVK